MMECVCVHEKETHACVCCRGETGETSIVELKMMVMMTTCPLLVRLRTAAKIA